MYNRDIEFDTLFPYQLNNFTHSFKMDVDMELDQDLMQRFSSMGTTDKDVLIREFQKLAGNNLNPSACAFFLDMNNW